MPVCRCIFQTFFFLISMQPGHLFCCLVESDSKWRYTCTVKYLHCIYKQSSQPGRELLPSAHRCVAVTSGMTSVPLCSVSWPFLKLHLYPSRLYFRFRRIQGVNGITEHLIKVQVKLLSQTSEAWCTPHWVLQIALGGKKVKEKKPALKEGTPHWENYELQKLIRSGLCPLRRHTLGTTTHDATWRELPRRHF